MRNRQFLPVCGAAAVLVNFLEFYKPTAGTLVTGEYFTAEMGKLEELVNIYRRICGSCPHKTYALVGKEFIAQLLHNIT